jgi:isoamylase
MTDHISASSNVSSRNKYTASQGSPKKLGAHLDAEKNGCNFAVYAPTAHKIWLCLFEKVDDDTEKLIAEIAMPARTGGIWHAFLEGAEAGLLYGYRSEGEFNPKEGLYFNPHKLLIDPYAHAINRKCIPHACLSPIDEQAYEKNDDFVVMDKQDTVQYVPKSIVVNHDFEWGFDKCPDATWSSSVVYEVHVKGFSKENPRVPKEIRGTYLGLAHDASIDYLKKLGVTSVQLLPCYTLMSELRLGEMGLENYWGYNPVNFFAPDPRYAYKDAVTEFKTMVKALHHAGIEVILDVVYNHTCEGGFLGPMINHKGLHLEEYYRLNADDKSIHADNSGCGNSVNLHHPYVLREVMDSMRHWMQEYHVDGFRFDLAVSLAREEYDYSKDSAFFKVIEQDPLLNTAKLIAEPWDVGLNGYQVGNFPDNWYECNDKYRDTSRSFWKGDHNTLADFCTRFMGSRDLFYSETLQQTRSLNYVSYHDGFSLNDIVSYNDKHNNANGEENRDGHGHNLSYNYGDEGKTSNPAVNRVRRRQMRNMIATLMLSQGAVHFLGGDEVARSQGGNNNAYCQDNELSWFNWHFSAEQRNQLEFTRQMILLSRSSNLFHDLIFTTEQLLDGPAHSDKAHWYRPDGENLEIADWHNPENHSIALLLASGVANPETHLHHCNEYFLVLINASTNKVAYKIPDRKHCEWELVFDTSINAGLFHPNSPVQKDNYLLESRSMAVLAPKGWFKRKIRPNL